jgi:serine/threonine protein kinase
MTTSDSAQTLEQRLLAGRLPAGEALRIAALIAHELRQMHEQDCAHGALTPAAILLGERVQLQPPSAALELTPYSAPELVEGWPADARSDVFSFGAIVYEMLTGRRAFDDATPAGSAPAPSGRPVIDRLVANCVAKYPDARFQSIQKVQIELKMLMNPTLRAGSAPAAPVHPVATPSYVAAPAPSYMPPPTVPDAAARTQMEDLEARMARRFEEQERAVASVERVANELLNALRTPPAVPPYSRPSGRLLESYDSDPAGRVEKALEMLHDKIARIDLVLTTAVERIQKLDESLDAFDTDAAALRDSVTRDIRNFERMLKQQSTAIESARTAMGQTDDLVERVVEALDSLQSMFITPAEERSMIAS